MAAACQVHAPSAARGAEARSHPLHHPWLLLPGDHSPQLVGALIGITARAQVLPDRHERDPDALQLVLDRKHVDHIAAEPVQVLHRTQIDAAATQRSMKEPRRP
jgi:hypothetical protein